MSERQILFDWLAQVARRQRWNQSIELGAKVTFWLLALLLLWQIMGALIPVWQVTAALLPLLILCAFGVLGWTLAQALRAPTLADAAVTADRLGGWHDQIKSALWFARQPSNEAGVSVLLARARATVGASDPRRLLPMRFTPMLYGAAGIAILSGLMAWWGPRLAHSGRAPQDAGQAQAWRSADVAGTGSSSSSGATDAAAGGARASAGSRAQAGATPEQTSSQTAQPADGGGVADETSRPPAPGQAGAEEAPPRAGASSEGRAARSSPQETSAEWLGSVVERLKEMMNKGELDGGDSSLRPSGDGQIDAKVNASERGNQQDMGSAPPETRMRNADDTGGSQLNLNALGGIGPRNTLPGDVMGEEQSGRNNSNSNSGPLGRRISSSRGGPGDDNEVPRGDPGGSAESPAIMGRKTARLALQLRRVPSPAKSAGERPEEEGTPEEFFAATRSQAARVALTPGAVAPRAGAGGDALSTEQTPLAYRAAVKDYFLSQHRKEK